MHNFYVVSSLGKVLTWDRLWRRNLQGPSFCSMCKMAEEYADHIFLHCSFSSQIWKDISERLQIGNLWSGFSLEECLKLLFEKDDLKLYKCIPFLAMWGIWTARNARRIFISHIFRFLPRYWHCQNIIKRNKASEF